MILKYFNLKLLYEDDESVLLFWQKKIFKGLFIVLVIFGSIPYVLSSKYALDQSEWHRVLFYTLIYLWVICIAFFGRVAFPVRVWAGITGFYLLGLFSMTFSGFMGSARLYLLCFSAFAAIFAGLRASLITLVINMATLALCGTLFFNGVFFWRSCLLPRQSYTMVCSWRDILFFKCPGHRCPVGFNQSS
ncbi:MAG: hypothetical protein ABIJ31_16175 [Pseudomonadota bacterium]